MNDRPALIDAKEASRLLHVGYKHLFDLAAEGVIPCIRIGRSLRFDPLRLEEFIRSGGESRG